MTLAAPIYTSFNSGEFSSLMEGRVDYDKYAHGLALCENFIPLIQGPATRRPGTKYVAEVKNSAAKTRIVRFKFSATDAYVIEIGDQYFRFYKDHGQVLDSSSVAYEISTPYFTADIFDLQFTQSADVLYIAHASYAPRKLLRFGDADWQLKTIDFQPPATYEKPDKPAIALTLGATTGTGVSLTAGSAFWLDADVGRTIKYGDGRLTITAVATSTAATCDIITDFASTALASATWDFEGSPATKATSSANGPIGATVDLTLTAAGWRSTDVGKYIKFLGGFGKITAYTSDTVVTVRILRLFNSGTDTATADREAQKGTWQMLSPIWDATNGYPAAVSFFGDRLYWGGSPFRPQTVWGSVVGDYENHSTGVADDSAVAFTLNSNDVNTIRWMLDDERGLYVGTLGGEWLVRASTQNQALTPTNIKADRSTSYGSTRIPPIRAGKAALYVQRAARKLRELSYRFDLDAVVAPDLTVLSEHISLSGFADVAFQDQPQSLLWLPRVDGVLIGLTYDRDQQVVAWHRHTLGGYSDTGNTEAPIVESVACIPSPDGARDDLWLVVQRNINGVTKRFVEYMTKVWERGDDATDAFYVDCGGTYDGTPVTSVSVPWLAGETVSVWADGAVHPNATVDAGGTVALQRAASKVQVGFGFQSNLQTMRPETGSRNGTAQGKVKRINKIYVRFLDTMTGKVGPRPTKLDTLNFRSTNDAMDAALPLFNGDKEVPWPGGYDRDSQIYVRVDTPAPMTITAIMPHINTEDARA